jgi:hypothetical protein
MEPDLVNEHRRQLRAGGIDVAAQERSGQLEVCSVRDLYLRDGRFDITRMLVAVEKMSSPADGAISRIAGHGEWGGEDWPGIEDFLEYEARLNQVVPQGRDTVVCLYDMSKTSAALMVDVLRTHPIVILGGMLYENPFYVPVEQFLSELRERKVQPAATSS